MNRYWLILYKSIFVLGLLLCCLACTEDDGGAILSEGQEGLVFTKPCLQWGASTDFVRKKMEAEGFSLVEDRHSYQDCFYLIYKGKRAEKKIAYLFQNDRLCVASVAVSCDAIQDVTQITDAFPNAVPVDGYEDTYLDVEKGTLIDYVVKQNYTVSGGEYWAISWAAYDMDVAQAVDLGLSVKWADVNVDICTHGYVSSSNASLVSWWAYGLYGWGDPTGGKVSNQLSLYPIQPNISGTIYDIASANWGGNWRVPTKEEMEELIEHCTWTWTNLGDNIGYMVEGPNGNSIFLPQSGYRVDSDTSKGNGYYWTSTLNPDDTDYPYVLTFGKDFKELNVNKDILRSYGCAVRPVQDN